MIKTIFKITSVLFFLVLVCIPNNLSSQNDGWGDALNIWHQSTSSLGDDGGSNPNPYDSEYQESTNGSSNCPCGVPPVNNAMPTAGQSYTVITWDTEIQTQWSWAKFQYVKVGVKVQKRCLVTPYTCVYIKMAVGPCCACLQKVC